MTASDIRQKFLTFFQDKEHQIVASSSLVPQDDSSVLFTTAGMQQFKPYYLGEKDPLIDWGSKNTVSIQKCLRTSDIDEIGDNTHLTMFEMMGNFSFGGYWKEEAIRWAHEFITKELGLEISYVTIFRGSKIVPKDEVSRDIWQKLGLKDIREEGMEDVFWGPTGQTGPCGPTTEIYCRNAKNENVEIWNIVFNEFLCHGTREELLVDKAKLSPLTIKGIDTGMGLERLLTIINKKESVFETDLFLPLVENLRNNANKADSKSERIIVDHLRASVFIIADGVYPANVDSGYILRRLIRRTIRYADQIQANNQMIEKLAEKVIEQYGQNYPELKEKREIILTELKKEEVKFRKTLANGIKVLDKNLSIKTNALIDTAESLTQSVLTGEFFFDLYQSFGFPLELAIEELKNRGQIMVAETENRLKTEFSKLISEHRDNSRIGADKKFKGGLAGTNPKEIQYHTATHLLLASLRQVLGQGIEQKGSNITTERLRFDFNWPDKLSNEEIKKIEDLVNEKIAAKMNVYREELSKIEARQSGAVGLFEDKYGERVIIYSIGAPTTSPTPAFSREFCGGPHVANTGELTKFKIIKEESVAAGIRRLKAVLE